MLNLREILIATMIAPLTVVTVLRRIKPSHWFGQCRCQQIRIPFTRAPKLTVIEAVTD